MIYIFLGFVVIFSFNGVERYEDVRLIASALFGITALIGLVYVATHNEDDDK